ncbi:2'-5' RNA ligase [candidate division Kazan bacterium RBG_13_50_9]|uniref:RNA 2',3'-cyclic phosphodiesterase n=1 Tax=candidate division Kazan bacterium RBG_13_50_9 TaxID=1798535 RepID=A0A1F4NSH0_UNCK3|nr:MAG: 2'-5' RNA ligase [candidate division Kazan bacterium RBG_13_50_9]
MKKRLFIAINFDASTKLAIAQIAQTLPTHNHLKKTAVDNLHLTLLFLGDTDEELIPEIQAALEVAAKNFFPLELTFTQMGVFPNPHLPQIVWLGLKGDGLILAQQHLSQQLDGMSFLRDSKPFRPHLTIARVKGPLPKETIGALRELRPPLPPLTIVSSIDLMASQLTPAGPIYTLISSHSLK